MSNVKDTIIDALLKSKNVSKEQLDKALETQRKKGVSLRKVLIEQGIVTEDEILTLLSERLYIPRLTLGKFKFDPEVLTLIPEHTARQYTIMPLSQIGNTLTIALADPLNVFALDDIRTLTGCDIDMVLSPEEEITRAIESQYHPESSKNMQQILDEASAQDAAAPTEDKNVELMRQQDLELSGALQDSQKAPIVKLVDLMLSQALKKRASDIHIEPEAGCLRVRFRVDGSLQEVLEIPKTNQNAVLARLKIVSNLDITENRIPQDGRFKVKAEGKEVDFRVSSLPTTFGQKFVLRLLDKSNLSVGLDKLGFSPYPAKVFKEAVTKPFGMLLVTGPTGSGKSTTLYSVLNQLNTPERNIITVEDPVEYQVEGITQLPVKPEVGLTFASGLRAILRQSPDIIMIGEIRDSETADIAVKASLTGQLVLSTLHTNDAISSITRLIDMGVEPFLVASSIVMLCAQRLCRKLCLKCRKPVALPAQYLKDLGLDSAHTYYAPGGCKYCNNSGFFGRIAILEAILVDDSMREMIMKKRSIDEIKAYAIDKCGMMTLRDDAFIKVKDGVTTIDEALRVTTQE